MAMTKDRRQDFGFARFFDMDSNHLTPKDVDDIVQNGYMGVLEIISHLQNLATANSQAACRKISAISTQLRDS